MHSAIIGSVASGYFFTNSLHKQNVDPTAPHIRVGTASGQPMNFASTCDLLIPQIPDNFPTIGHVMPGFKENLAVMVPMCDTYYTVIFVKHAVTIYIPTGNPIITGWSEADGPRLCRMSLMSSPEDIHLISSSPDIHKTSLQVFSAYELPSVEALVRYFRTAADFPVRDTWLKAIKAGNFASWPGLIYHNAAKYYPISDETLKGHMVQLCQVFCSTKPKPS